MTTGRRFQRFIIWLRERFNLQSLRPKPKFPPPRDLQIQEPPLPDPPRPDPPVRD